jgi:hypothetical protein
VPETVTVTSPSGATSTVRLVAAAPGRATGAVPAPEAGVYQVGDGTRTAFAAATVINPLEYADLRATASVLQPIARASGGSVRFIGDTPAALRLPDLRRVEMGRETAGRDWIGLQRRHDHVVTGLEAIPLLPPWAALPLLLAVVVIAWRREGSG